MRKIPYINYKELNGFYAVQRVAAVLNLDVRELLEKAQQYNVHIRQNDKGRYFLDSAAIKKLHYRLYHESRGRRIV